MTPDQRRSLLLALPVAFLVGIGLFLGGVTFAKLQVDLLIAGERATGTVIALEPSSDTSSSGRATHFPIIAFETRGGETITFRHRTGASPAAYQEGEQVLVTYLPGSPQDALIDEPFRNWLLPLILLICGAGLFSISGYWFLKMRRSA